MTSYALHPEVFRELNEIREYIAFGNPDAADRLVDEILDCVAGLVVLPHRGIRLPHLTSRPLRFTHVRDYLIAYALEKRPLWVVAVVHGRRSPRTIAAILRSRE